MPTRDEVEAELLASVQATQALHRRLVAAREACMEPDPDDVAEAQRLSESPYAYFDRVNVPDER
jgi:hypothetical protein